MRLRRVVIGLVVVAAVCALAWLGGRDTGDTPPPPDTAPTTQPETTRADTRVARPPREIPAVIQGVVVRGYELELELDRTVELRSDGRVAARTRTDAAAAFRFEHVEPGAEHELRVTAEGCRTVRVTSLALVPGETRDVGALILHEPRVVGITVTDEHGTPVPAAEVHLFREPRGTISARAVGRTIPPPIPVETVRVDEAGECEVHLAAGARHAIVARAPGCAPAVLPQAEIALVDAREERLRLVLWTPEALTGTVTGSNGRPAPGATVFARPQPKVWGMHGERALSTAVWQITTADGTGAFRLDELAAGPLEIWCARPGGLPSGRQVVHVPEIATVQLVLAESATIEGAARTTDGRPLAGVTVRTATDASSQTVVTGADGRWSTPGLPTGELLHVDLLPPPGWLGPRERGNDLQPSGVAGGWYQKRLVTGQTLRLDATFERAAVVTGRVTRDGQPEPGAWVETVTLTDGALRGGSDLSRADGDGVYRLSAVAPGRVVVNALPARISSEDTWRAFRALWEGDPPATAPEDAVEVAAGGTTRIDVEIAVPEGLEEELAQRAERRARMDAEMDDGAIRITGNVTTADGVPLRDAVVTAVSFRAGDTPDGTGSFFDFYDWNTVSVAAGGHFDGTVQIFEEPKVILVIATDARHGVARKLATPVEPDTGGLPTYRCDLELPVPPTLRGRVEHEGRPVANADVRAGGSVVARTGEDGSFEIPFPESERLSIRADGYLDARHRIDDDEPAVIELRAAGTLTGRVIDDDGRPVAGIHVLPVDDDDDPIDGYDEWEVFASHPVPITDDDGRFRVERVPARGVYVRISSPAPDEAATAPFFVGPFDVSDGDAVIVVRTPRRLTGRVVGPDGEPVAEARVRCVPDDDSAAEASARTDESGGFSFETLQSGAYEVAAIPPRDSDLQPAAERIAPDQEHVEIALTRSVFISGTVHWRDGSVFGPSLRLEPLDPVPPALAGRDLRVDPEDDGTFRVAVTEGMRYAIEVYLRRWKGQVEVSGGEEVLAGASGVVLTATRVVDAVDAEALESGTVAGTIVTSGGKAVPGAEVLVIPSSDATLTATTDESGRFSVTGAGRDRGATTVGVAVYADGRATTQVDDVRIGTTDLRIALKPARTISGRLLTADGSPATGWRIRALSTSDPVHDLWRADPDAEGAFVLHGVARGTWTLEAIVERGGAIREVVPLGTVKGGAKGLELRLP